MNDCLLAIELSSRHTEVGIGRGPTWLGHEPVHRATRHADDLMPAISRLFERHHLEPHDLTAVAVSLGPGGFTGLRLGVTTAKMLAYTLGADVVAVATALAVAESIPPHPAVTPGSSSKGDHGRGGSQRLRVALAGKRDSLWITTFEPNTTEAGRTDTKGADGAVAPAPWLPVDEGRLATIEALPDAPELRPDLVVVDHAPEALVAWCAERNVPLKTATFSAESCWRTGRRLLAAGRTTRAVDLVPIYARPPEAVRLWEQRGSA